MKKKTAIIVNPISGMGRQKKIETLLKEKRHASGMAWQPQRGVKAAKSVRPLTFGGSMPPKAVCKSTSLLHGNFIALKRYQLLITIKKGHLDYQDAPQ